MAEIYRSDLQLANAAQQHERAMQLGGDDADELRSYAGFQSAMGRPAQAMRLAEQALALDPLNAWSHATRARVLYDARRYGEVVKRTAELKKNTPELYENPLTLGNSLMMLRRFDEARKVYAEEPADDPLRLAAEAVLDARSGNHAAALSILSRIQKLYGEAASYQFAQIYANVGQAERAFAALDQGWRIKDPGLFGLKVDAMLDPIRKDSRFGALLRTVGFPA
jgi:tetratricopeptide (TPR) repeat protein